MSKLVLVICVALAACGDSQEDKLTAVRDAVCACKIAGCAEKAMKQVPQDKIESNHKTQKLARDMVACLQKLYDAQKPSTDPDDDHDDH
jgi:hypothetical protein